MAIPLVVVVAVVEVVVVIEIILDIPVVLYRAATGFETTRGDTCREEEDVVDVYPWIVSYCVTAAGTMVSSMILPLLFGI